MSFHRTLFLARRSITPVAGRARGTRTKPKAKLPPTSSSSTTPASSAMNTTLTSSSSSSAATEKASATTTTAAATAATAATPRKQRTFFQRNKQGITNGLWSFVMFFMGIQVLRAKYAEDAAKEELTTLNKELQHLKASLHPETSDWWEKIVAEAKLTATQKEILSASLGSMLVYGEVLTVGGAKTAIVDVNSKSVVTALAGTTSSSSVGNVPAEKKKTTSVRMI